MFPMASRRVGCRHKWSETKPMKKLDALGMVETRGFVSLVEAANAMAQIADVDLVHYEKVGHGFTTIIIRGPLEEVRRAVGAGVAAAKRVGDVVAAHVLSRVHPKAERLLPLGRREWLESGTDRSPGDPGPLPGTVPPTGSRPRPADTLRPTSSTGQINFGGGASAAQSTGPKGLGHTSLGSQDSGKKELEGERSTVGKTQDIDKKDKKAKKEEEGQQ